MKKAPSFFINFMFYQNDKVSHTKFWSNVGNIIISIAFVYSVYTGKADNELWLIYGALVMGNGTLNKVLSLKYGNKTDKPAEGTDASTR